jgi:hypothetical protein
MAYNYSLSNPLYGKKQTGLRKCWPWLITEGKPHTFFKKCVKKWFSECENVDDRTMLNGYEMKQGVVYDPTWVLRTHPALIFSYVIAEPLVATWCDFRIIPRHQLNSLSIGALYSIKVCHWVAAMVCHVLRGTLGQKLQEAHLIAVCLVG